MPGLLDPDAIGPVDVAVILFEGNQFNGDLEPALADLAEAGTVRILDLAFVSKNADGDVRFVEVSDDEVADAFEALSGREFELLSEEDLEIAAEALEPDSSALVIAWENTWAARFAAAVRGSNGRVLSLDRVPHANVVIAIEALDKE